MYCYRRSGSGFLTKVEQTFPNWEKLISNPQTPMASRDWQGGPDVPSTPRGILAQRVHFPFFFSSSIFCLFSPTSFPFLSTRTPGESREGKGRGPHCNDLHRGPLSHKWQGAQEWRSAGDVPSQKEEKVCLCALCACPKPAVTDNKVRKVEWRRVDLSLDDWGLLFTWGPCGGGGTWHG